MPPRYYHIVDRSKYLAYWLSRAREFGLHAGLDFERFLQDLYAADVAHELELRDLNRQVEDLS